MFVACVATTDDSTDDAQQALVQPLAPEVEPNATSASATPLGATPVSTEANIYDIGDTDFFSFTAAAGDRVYAATMTSFSADGTDTSLDLIAPDGVTVIENDNDNGIMSGLASSIAGAPAAAGTNYLRVRHNTGAAGITPYHLHTMVKSGMPVAEVEPNDMQAQATPMPASGWVSGALATAADIDLYSITLNAGDTVFASLDLDPERDGDWAGQLLFGPLGAVSLQINDAGGAGPDSEALFVTVKAGGTYYFAVNAGVAGALGTYHLAVSVQPQASQALCTTYTSSDVPKTIPAAGGLVSSTISVPAGVRIGSISVGLNLTHTNMPDLDVHLASPAGNDNALFTDIGSNTFTTMDTVLSDSAAFPISVFTTSQGMMLQPENQYRLHWFDGEDAGGMWTLRVEDDTNNANGGTLTGWNLTICTPPPPAACPPNTFPVTVLNADFEAGDQGFTHSGALDEWARGTPAGSVITTCNSGTKCFKNNLAGGYSPNSAGDLSSANLNLAGLVAPIRLSWAQKYQIENAAFDKASVDVVPAAGPAVRVFEHYDATMTTGYGLAAATLQESAGWGQREANLDSFAGQTVHVVYHFTSDGTVQLGGWGIDDVKVTACKQNVCGDGVKTGNEGCDDGNLVDGDGCDSNCTVTACGNGIKTMGEACDDGNAVNGDGCDTNCTATACGNGIKTMGEACDDGNLVDGDGCDSNCTATACGNGIKTMGEACDDGNLVDGDGCDSNCTATACGNGIKTMGEACDDGNLTDGDGCDSNCTATACGNNIITLGEVCDDGNLVDGDGCDSNCTPTECGNNIVTDPETCDDGNLTDGDGCDSNCSPTGCGNGVATGDETCDDGNKTDGDGCDSNCTTTACGNGIVTDPEECDDSNLTDGDGCDSNCTTTACGNGIVTDPEECDDGNTVDGDGCDSKCNNEGSTGTGGTGGSGGSTGGSGGSTGGSGGAGATTDTGGTGGVTETGAGASTGGTEAQGGCGCAVPGETPAKPVWAPLAALAALALLRRRRNTR